MKKVGIVSVYRQTLHSNKGEHSDLSSDSDKLRTVFVMNSEDFEDNVIYETKNTVKPF